MGAVASTIDAANAIQTIAHSLKELNRVEEAITVIDKAIDLLREGNYPFVVDTMRTKASWLNDLGRYEESIKAYSEIVAINEIEGETEFVGRDLLSVTYNYWKLGKWVEVIEHASKAREKFKVAKMVDEVLWCDCYLANAYAELGNADFALDFGQRAYELAELRDHRPVKCNSAVALGKADVLKAQFEKAEERLLEARSIAQGSTDWETITRIEKEFINLYLVQGKVGSATEVERRLKSLQEIVE